MAFLNSAGGLFARGTRQQIAALWMAQLRTMRNHLPRKSLGSVLAAVISILWYGGAIAMGVLLAVAIPHFRFSSIASRMPGLLLGVWLFWQVGPLFTLSSGWSLELPKLLIYPLSRDTLFAIEAILRLTTAPEMLPILAGVFIGLERHQHVPHVYPLLLILYVPLNLFLSLSFRELLLQSFPRSRFREVITVACLALGLLPQILLRTGLAFEVRPYFRVVSNSEWLPWGEMAHMAMGVAKPLEWGFSLLYLGGAYLLARMLFRRSLLRDVEPHRQTIQGGNSERDAASVSKRFMRLLRKVVPGVGGAIVVKDIGSLARMPRMRLMFGMACLFSFVLFFSFAAQIRDAQFAGPQSDFIRHHFLAIVTLYGTLLLSDALILNVFGFDRSAVAIYFLAPVRFDHVLLAKNITAVVVLVCQSMIVLTLVLLVRMPLRAGTIVESIASVAVVAVYLLAIGNLSSVHSPRPFDPKQTFRTQGGGRMQAWLLLCSVGMLALLGAAYLARWAFNSQWAGLLVLLMEFGVGAVLYRIAIESALRRGLQERERIVEELSASATPLSAD